MTWVLYVRWWLKLGIAAAADWVSSWRADVVHLAETHGTLRRRWTGWWRCCYTSELAMISTILQCTVQYNSIPATKCAPLNCFVSARTRQLHWLITGGYFVNNASEVTQFMHPNYARCNGNPRVLIVRINGSIPSYPVNAPEIGWQHDNERTK